MRFSWLLSSTVCLACVRAPPPLPPPLPPAPPPPTIQIPEGCASSSSGLFLLSTDSTFRYEANDDLDAGRLVMAAFHDVPVDAGPTPRRFTRDGGLPWLTTKSDAGIWGSLERNDAGPSALALLVFDRTPTGFTGVSTRLDGGCAFEARILECRPEGLLLESEARRSADCSKLSDAGVRRFVLLRPDAGWTDAGRTDAGLDTAQQTVDGGVDAGPQSTPAS